MTSVGSLWWWLWYFYSSPQRFFPPSVLKSERSIGEFKPSFHGFMGFMSCTYCLVVVVQLTMRVTDGYGVVDKCNVWGKVCGNDSSNVTPICCLYYTAFKSKSSLFSFSRIAATWRLKKWWLIPEYTPHAHNSYVIPWGTEPIHACALLLSESLKNIKLNFASQELP